MMTHDLRRDVAIKLANQANNKPKTPSQLREANSLAAAMQKLFAKKLAKNG